LHADFKSKTLDDCQNFIQNSWSVKDARHLAIVSADDEYMGTVSLKNIDEFHKDAEFAITVRKLAMGKGYAQGAMHDMLRIAFGEMQLHCVYWCVSSLNIRALRFYNKLGFKTIQEIRNDISARYQHTDSLIWYRVCDGE
jgi:RimJ/RimL family protein N-acetyltransferase